MGIQIHIPTYFSDCVKLNGLLKTGMIYIHFSRDHYIIECCMFKVKCFGVSHSIFLIHMKTINNNMTNNDRQYATELYEWNTTHWRSPESDEFVQMQMSSVNITDEYIFRATEPDNNTFSPADFFVNRTPQRSLR